MPISLLIVDDHALFRESLCHLLETDSDLTIVGTAPNALHAIKLAKELRPQVILMDIDMPGMTCFEAARQIMVAQPATRMIFLSAFFHDHYIEQALAVDARGYLTKSESTETVINAIKRVAGGRVYYSPEVRQRIVADEDGVHLASPTHSRLSHLTGREIEVLRYLARGLAKKEIAQQMFLSVKTVEGHAEKLMKKLDVHDRVALARYAIREGISEP